MRRPTTPYELQKLGLAADQIRLAANNLHRGNFTDEAKAVILTAQRLYEIYRDAAPRFNVKSPGGCYPQIETPTKTGEP